jgi:hypothetical protein
MEDILLAYVKAPYDASCTVYMQEEAEAPLTFFGRLFVMRLTVLSL